MKKLLLFMILVMTVVGCDVGYQLKAESPGKYICKKEGHPTYTFDTSAVTSTLFMGSNPGIEFVDLQSGKLIRLYTSETVPYACSPLPTDTEKESEG